MIGCQQQMAVQPSPRPDEASAFYPDGRADRPAVQGTIARGHLRTDRHFFRGKRSDEAVSQSDAVLLIGGGAQALNLLLLAGYQTSERTQALDKLPFPVTLGVLEHGRDRFMIYCVVCHDALGTGHGKIVERGYSPPPSYHIDRLRTAPVGHFFDVITNGYGSMPRYKQQIPPRDRWAIAAYIRALQVSQHFAIKDLAPDMQADLAQAKQNGRDRP